MVTALAFWDVIGPNGDAFDEWPTGPSVFDADDIFGGPEARCGACDEPLSGDLGEFVNDDGENVLCHAECGLNRGWALA